MTAKSKPTLGLDWDGTVSAYPEACAMLAKGFGRCIVITLNDDITLEQADIQDYLNRSSNRNKCK